MSEPAIRHPWRVLFFLCIPVFIGSIDLTIVSAILPEVIVSLGLPAEARLDDAFWMLTGYLVAYTLGLACVGRLSDIVGRRWVYLAFLGLFMFGSYFVAIAHTYPTDWYARAFRMLYPDSRPPAEEIRTLHMIILGRVVQALGAGAMPAVTMAMVGDLFPKGKRARPLGVVGAVDTVGWMLGHLYGGIMVNFFGRSGAAIVDAFARLGLSISPPDWRTLFWFNLVTGGLTIVAVVLSLWRVRQPRLREPFDLLGGLLIVAALVMLSLGLGSTDASPPARVEDFQSAEEAGRGMAWPLLVLAVLAFVLFVLVERWRKYPLFNLSIYRERNVAIAAFANVCVGFTLTIGLVTMPILVNIREAQTSLEGVQEAALIAGLLLSALTVPMALSAIPGGWLSDKRGYRAAVAGGLALSVFGFALMGFSWGADTPYALMGLQMAITGTGLGLTIAPIGAAVVNAAKPSERGGASGMVLALRLLGMTLALSSLTNFAIGRVNRLVQERTLAGDTRTDLYLITSVEVVRELMLLGMVISLVALAAAWFMRGGSAGETLEEVEETALEESARPSEPVPAA